MRQRKTLTRTTAFSLMIAAVLFAAIGCGTAAATQAPTKPPATETAEPTEAAASQTEAAYIEQTRQAESGSSDTTVGPYDESADPKADIAAAMTLAKADSKSVLLDFGANWCVDCVVLSKLFEDPKVKPFLDENYHVVKIDVGYWDTNLDVVDQYDNPIELGIPAVVVLTPDGKVVATTKAGELATASTATADDILGYLQKWAPGK